MKALTNKLLVGVVSAISALALVAPPAFAAGDSATFTKSPDTSAKNVSHMYTISVQNTGDADITKVKIHAPSNLTFTGFVDLPADTTSPTEYEYLTQTIPVGETGNYFISGLSSNFDSTGHFSVQVSSDVAYTVATSTDNTLVVGDGGGVGASIGTAVAAINPTPTAMFAKALSVAPIVALGILVFFFLTLLRGLVSGLNKGKTKLSVGYGAGPERTDLIKGIKSGKYHG